MRHELQDVDFCGRDAPWCYFASVPLQVFDSFAHYFEYWHPIEFQHVVARVLQGRRCESSQTLFREWAAALQFPYYFGHNWAAFSECIGDLAWLQATCYVMFITQVDLVLPRSAAEFNVFMHTLEQAHNEWKIPNRESMDEPTAAFTVVFHADPDKADEALARLRAAGADPVEARFSDEFIKLTTDRP